MGLAVGMMGSGERLIDVYQLAIFLPSIAVATRRLHDINRSGWWQLIVFTGIGAFVLLYWMVKKGDSGSNRFGPPQ